MLGFSLNKHTFVGTATAIGLLVDSARMPVYLATQYDDIVGVWPLVALASVGVVAGTLLGGRVLARLPESWFRRVLAVILAVLGVAMILRGIFS